MKDLFYQLITKLYAMGEVNFNNISIDNIKIEDNTNKYTFKWKKSIIKYDKKLYVSQLLIELREKIPGNIAGNLGIYLRISRSMQVKGVFRVIKENHKFR